MMKISSVPLVPSNEDVAAAVKSNLFELYEGHEKTEEATKIGLVLVRLIGRAAITEDDFRDAVVQWGKSFMACGACDTASQEALWHAADAEVARVNAENGVK